MFIRIFFFSLLIGAVFGASAEAHKPLFTDDAATDPDTAIVVPDADISYVVYREITDDAPQIWLTFDATAGQALYAQLGVPVIDRLEDFRPALALLGPGLPDIGLPFEVPAGLGGVILTTDDVEEPEFFHEPFTGTDSWILGQIRTNAAEAGQHYIVAYVPSGETGKLWIAPGEEEQFGAGDILSLPATIRTVRQFHEVDDIPVPCGLPILAVALLAYVGFVRVYRRRTA